MKTLTLLDSTAPPVMVLLSRRIVVANAGSQLRERQEVAVVLRKLAQLLLGDVGRDLVGLGFDDGRLGRDGHFLARADLQPEVEPLRLPEQDDGLARLRREAGELGLDRVGTGRHREVEEPVDARHQDARDPRVVVHGADRDSGKRPSILVVDRSPERSRRRLRGYRESHQDGEETPQNGDSSNSSDRSIHSVILLPSIPTLFVEKLWLAPLDSRITSVVGSVMCCRLCLFLCRTP